MNPWLPPGLLTPFPLVHLALQCCSTGNMQLEEEEEEDNTLLGISFKHPTTITKVSRSVSKKTKPIPLLLIAKGAKYSNLTLVNVVAYIIKSETTLSIGSLEQVHFGIPCRTSCQWPYFGDPYKSLDFRECQILISRPFFGDAEKIKPTLPS